MIEIPFVLVPIILLALVAVITYAFNNFSLSEPRTDLGFFMYIVLTLVFIVTIAYYIGKGLQFIYNHVTII